MGGHFGWEEGEHPGLLEERIGGELGRSRAFPSLARGLDFSKQQARQLNYLSNCLTTGFILFATDYPK
jgi:hypothetical protein